ncbi:MAG: hypothetical protein K6C32_01330 [Bacilli bacterium]|nr:hypothetical protein [Bacilli bacterium]
MKNKLLKFIPVLAIGVSLTACTILSDLGIGGKGDITKFAKYKNQVTLTEFIDKMKNSVKDTDYVKDDYKLPDSKLIAGAKLEASQKLTNSNYSKETRNEASIKASVSADASYDKDNNSIKGKLEGSYSTSEKNAILGEASNKYSTDLEGFFMPHGLNYYSLVDSNNETYYDFTMPEGFDLNASLSLGMTSIMRRFSELSLSEGITETEIETQLAKYGLSLKYYYDSNVMTIVGDWDYTLDLGRTTHTYDSEMNPITTEDNYGKAEIKATLKLQFKVVKVVKIRFSAEGTMTVDYFKNHSSLYNEYYPLGLSGLAGDCEVGDQEVIKLKAEAGVNLEHEKVNHKLPDLSKYKDITPKLA